MSRFTGKSIKSPVNHALFFIAVIPPLELLTQVTQLKEEIKERFHSKHALNAPPHITLHMPFKWKAKKLDLLLETMNGLSSTEKRFDIELKGFSAFAPRVIFIDVTPNDQLISLQKNVTTDARRKLRLDNADYKSRGFHPHMTIAFRDLKKSKFVEAWQDFENRAFDATFQVTSLTLLKREDQRWEVFQEFPFEEASDLKNF